MVGSLDWVCGPASALIRRARVVAIGAALLATACDFPTPKIYSADPITAWVVDADAGKPIEGANVLAMWEMKYGLENHGTNYAMVLEAVTDAEGRFALPGWGPRLVLKPGAVTNAAPVLTIFLPGYRVSGGANSGVLELAPSHMKSDWDGKVFQLRRFEGTSQQYSDHLHRFLQTKIESLFSNGCNHLSLPRLLRSVDRQARELEKQVPDSRLLNLNQLSNTFRGKCGDAEAEVGGALR
ncbi:MAG: carboxypeptidase-like regulatory domain-containing protein [Burkholderiales bacterium]